MDSYCVKCKCDTTTLKPKYEMSKNMKPIMKGTCQKCKKGKCKFLSSEEVKRGGFVFTVPALLAGLGAAGSLAGGAAGIATAINKKSAGDKLLAETKRHNKAMEGKGIFLKPQGTGLHLKPYKK